MIIGKEEEEKDNRTDFTMIIGKEEEEKDNRTDFTMIIGKEEEEEEKENAVDQGDPWWCLFECMHGHIIVICFCDVRKDCTGRQSLLVSRLELCFFFV